MIYRGQFKDISDVLTYRVDIITNNDSSGQPVQITLGETPCVISTQSSGFFDPIKPSICTIQLLTKDFIPQLYSPTPHGVEVIVYNVNAGNPVLFHGYMTPCMYTMGYTYQDVIDLEAVDCISTLQYYEYTCETPGQPSIVSMYSILKRACQLAGYSSNVFKNVTGNDSKMSWINSFTNVTNSIENIYVNEANFFDDDDSNTPWKWYEVVEEIMKFLGWSFNPYAGDVWLTDYRYLANYVQYGSTPFKYSRVNLRTNSISRNEYAYGWLANWTYGDNLPVSFGTPKLSLDEVYNKIEITANTYDIEGIHQLDDSKYYVSINKESNIINVDVSGTTSSNRYGGFLGMWRKTSSGGYPDYAGAYSRITQDSGWKHYYWRVPSSIVAQYNSNSTNALSFTNYLTYGTTGGYAGYSNGINGAISTIGASFCKYVVGNDYTNASDCIMFLKMIDENNWKYHTIWALDNQVPYVLSYESPEDLIYRPVTGTTWITIDASLLWQKNQTVNRSDLLIVDETNKNYVTVPLEGGVKLGSGSNETEFSPVNYPMDSKKTYFSSSGSTTTKLYRDPSDPYGDTANHGNGYKMWKMKVNIGNYWWNGSSWESYSGSVDGATCFYISYNNNPSSTDVEAIKTMTWMGIVPNNSDYYDKTGKRKYAIPVTSSSPVTHGHLKIYVYPPSFLAQEWESAWSYYTTISKNLETNYTWKDFGPAVYAKDFEVAIEWTNDNDLWWIDNDDSSTDIVYSHEIDDDYCNEFDGLELKINTAAEDKPISKSFVSNGDTYLGGIAHQYGGAQSKEQEKNLIDMYYDHFSKPCKEYTLYVSRMCMPFCKFTFPNNISGEFFLDSQKFDVKKMNNELTVIEYKSDLD